MMCHWMFILGAMLKLHRCHVSAQTNDPPTATGTSADNCSTSGIPTKVRIESSIAISDGVLLTWTASCSGMASYTVAYQCGSLSASKSFGNKTSARMTGLGTKKTCTFTVTATNSLGNTSLPSNNQTATTGASEEKSGIDLLIIVAAGGGGFAVILVIVCVGCCVCCRKRSKSQTEQSTQEAKSPSKSKKKKTSTPQKSREEEQILQYAELDLPTSNKKPPTRQQVAYSDITPTSPVENNTRVLQYAELEMSTGHNQLPASDEKQLPTSKGVTYAGIRPSLPANINGGGLQYANLGSVDTGKSEVDTRKSESMNSQGRRPQKDVGYANLALQST